MDVFEKDHYESKNEYEIQSKRGRILSYLTFGLLSNKSRIQKAREKYERNRNSHEEYKSGMDTIDYLIALRNTYNIEGIAVSDELLSNLRYKGIEGYGDNWEVLRHEILERDNHICQEKDFMCKGPLQVHHMIELSKGGTNNHSNLITLCLFHHSEKHAHLKERYNANLRG